MIARGSSLTALPVLIRTWRERWRSAAGGSWRSRFPKTGCIGRSSGPPANAGRWTLRVEEGRGRVERGGRGRIALDARGLAALYSGFHGADTLAAFGRLKASAPEDLATAVALFAGPTPWMPDMF